mmetsp:Transcript_10300/g.34039  ORF Transcript_10300/g.34039 Transcript_10300/m.34039 type:complete len:232 (-) Transcript_10300:882-1577(-)
MPFSCAAPADDDDGHSPSTAALKADVGRRNAGRGPRSRSDDAESDVAAASKRPPTTRVVGPPPPGTTPPGRTPKEERSNPAWVLSRLALRFPPPPPPREPLPLLDDDEPALFRCSQLEDDDVTELSFSSRSRSSMAALALAMAAVFSGVGKGVPSASPAREPGGVSGPTLPNIADFLRRKAEFQRFLTAFSARPGSSLAIFVQAFPQRCWASANIVSSSWVQPPFLRLGSR